MPWLMDSVAPHRDCQKDSPGGFKQIVDALHGFQITVGVFFGVISASKTNVFYHRTEHDYFKSLIPRELIEVALYEAEALDNRRWSRPRIDSCNFVSQREHGGNDGGFPRPYLKSTLWAWGQIRTNP